MTDTVLSLTGPDIIAILRDVQRRKEAADKISQVYFQLTAALNGNMDQESQEAAQRILAGVQTKERNLTDEIRQWLLTVDGTFSVTECDKELHIVTKEDKAARRQVFHRFLTCDKPLLEHDQNVNQRYKALHEREIIEMDYKNADPEDYLKDIKMRYIIGG